VALAACALFAANAPALAAVPTTSLVEGALLGGDGGPVADGSYAVTFRLYKSASEAEAGWTEGPVDVVVTKGQFQHVLGSKTQLTPDTLGSLGTPWLGMQVESDPELPRKAMHSVPFSSRAAVAESLDCSGCIQIGHLDAQLLAPYAKTTDLAKVATSGSYADLAGAPQLADVALSGGYADLTGVPDLNVYAKAASLAAVATSGTYDDLKGTPDLSGYAKAGDLAAVAATGNYADLEGKPALAKLGDSCGTGLVIKGLKADGTYECAIAMDPTALPADGLNEVSNGVLSNEFTETLNGKAPLPIPDNNPIGGSDFIDVPDLGVAKDLTVSLSLTNSNVAQIKIILFDPEGTQHVLYSGGTTGQTYSATWPKPVAAVSGDLTTWKGKNPKGKWSLTVLDSGYFNNTFDGEVTKWSIQIATVSSKKVHVSGDLIVSGSILGGNLVPKGAVMAFNLSACPTGWSELTAARGRYVVGLPPGGTLAAAVGTSLSNGENRPVGQHDHSINDPGHAHELARDSDSGPDGGSGAVASEDYANYNTMTYAATTGITIANAGSVAGTNAPYLQLLMCQKD
jgi:subtilisin-like proprotein convertase family protein